MKEIIFLHKGIHNLFKYVIYNVITMKLKLNNHKLNFIILGIIALVGLFVILQTNLEDNTQDFTQNVTDNITQEENVSLLDELEFICVNDEQNVTNSTIKCELE